MPFRYPIGRSPVYARRGMVCSSQVLASTAGLQILWQGGNAVDAAIATAAVQTVIEPGSTGLGGDGFALVWWAKDQQLYGLNGSGRAPAGLSIDQIGADQMPERGPLSVTVPGVVDCWWQLHQRFGRLSWDQILQPAIDFAATGFPVQPIAAAAWRAEAPLLAKDPDAAACYLPAPQASEIAELPRLAQTLRVVAAQGRDGFYQGAVAAEIARACAVVGCPLNESDLAAHTSDWIEPLSTTYRDVTLYELPPNGHGLVALQMLNFLEGENLSRFEHNSADYLHRLIEAKKLAYADRDAFYGDLDFSQVPLTQLVSKAYAQERWRLFKPERALPEPVPPGTPSRGDTVYLCAVDSEGNAVSLINSLFDDFGSGLVAGETGVVLQNRGSMFSLEPGHPNSLAPRKRPLHTIIPAMAFRDGKPWLVFGVMGGHLQPHGQVQVLLNQLEFGMDAQQAGEAPRFFHEILPGGNRVSLEPGIGATVAEQLAALGHAIGSRDRTFGGYQAIAIDSETGVLTGGSDPRKDGSAVGF
ncbi:gamma-glutamyltransferase [Leptolyngbya sp. FACHB-261]|uniref:gamma-glutamyltransferase n=1 Tax=Leptolyngbya sp. FACHB-261 TaxID=2692806 RepID=UPI00168A24EA|nr:gamma-glutamyltransferase [Leptolyngbya sp. FACHB-261]MBD2100567.1 gamma-glutamyltransferase [Leptolyngbya sp. FACHB-261]